MIKNELSNNLNRITKFLIFILLFINLFLYINESLLVLETPEISLDYGEGLIVYETQLIHDGKNVYSNYINKNDLVLINPYPPMFQIISSLFLWFNINPLISGRFLSILCTIFTSLVVYFMLHKEFNIPKTLSLICSLLIFSIPHVFIYSIFARVDMLGVFLAIVSLYFFIEDRFYLGTLFLSLALYTRQSHITLFIAVFLYYMWKREYLKCGILVIFAFALHIISLFLIPNYFENVVLCNLYQDIIIGKILVGLKSVFKYCLLFILMAFYVLLSCKNLKIRFIIIYFIISLILNTVSYGKSGSAINYFLEFLIVGIIIFAIGIYHLYMKRYKLYYITTIIVTILLIINFTFINLNWFIANENFLNMDWNSFYDEIDRFENPMFIEEPYVAYKTKNPVVDLFLLSKMAKKGVWNQSSYIGNISDKKYSAIITTVPLENYNINDTDGRYTEEMVESILDNYYLNNSYMVEYYKGTYKGFFIYLPNAEG